MNPSVITESISSLQVSDVQNLKGGEKTTSEWEELEKLSKDDLIIELVKERTARRNVDRILRSVVEVEYPVKRKYSVYGDEYDSNYEITSREWAYRIAQYAFEHSDGDFSPFDLESYGLDSDQSMEAFYELRKNGIVTDPSYDQDDWFRWPANPGNSIGIPIMRRCLSTSKPTPSRTLTNSAEPVTITRSNQISMGASTLP